jgi:CMP-N-acetylneuraminic acid synthetase
MQKTTSMKQQKNTSIITQSASPLLNQTKFFEVMYVQNNEDQSVEVYESTVLDFNAIIENLNEGNSVFITKKQPIANQGTKKKKQTDEYINHV